jgi:hypothetical protein
MKIVLIFLQIVAFPLSFLVASVILYVISSRYKLQQLFKFASATNFVITTYIVGGVIMFPLYFAFHPVKIEGVTYLPESALPYYWGLCYIISVIMCMILSYYLFFKVNPSNINIKSALIIGFYQLPLGWFFEIVIYVYMRKTIPTIFDYFFGKNFPWLNINWLIGAFAPLLAVLIINHRRRKKLPTTVLA